MKEVKLITLLILLMSNLCLTYLCIYPQKNDNYSGKNAIFVRGGIIRTDTTKKKFILFLRDTNMTIV